MPTGTVPDAAPMGAGDPGVGGTAVAAAGMEVASWTGAAGAELTAAAGDEATGAAGTPDGATVTVE